MVAFWGRCTTHFGRDFSGDWDAPWGYDLDFDPWPFVAEVWQRPAVEVVRFVDPADEGQGRCGGFRFFFFFSFLGSFLQCLILAVVFWKVRMEAHHFGGTR